MTSKRLLSEIVGIHATDASGKNTNMKQQSLADIHGQLIVQNDAKISDHLVKLNNGRR